MGNVSATGHRGGRPAVLAAWLFLAAAFSLTRDAFAQAAIPACGTPVARLVSLQGNVELQRAGSSDWLPVTRLDTTLCAGDRLRTDALSRAALFVQPETLVRVDQNTAIRVKQSTDEIEVEFFAAELVERLRPPQSCGAGYFISRFPRKFKVTTPHMNAAVEGTEFMVESSCEATKLTVLEGKVASRSVKTGDTRLVEAGNSVQAGTGGDGAIAAVVKPQDAVQWVLRYPPISDEAGGTSLSDAERSLRSGGVNEALAAIDAVLAGDPSNSDAHALRSVIQLAKNDKDGAKASASKATELGAGNYRAWLARSYAHQAEFDLDAALASARRAEELRSDSALAHARVAELLLSVGDVRRAEVAARAAVASGRAESHAHSILGFVHLAEIDTKAARADFQAAIERDSFAALPRLGLGLAMIREGELKQGREQIEIAVALDPLNSLLRSYAGKAYYEENERGRDALASTQFTLAKQIDPHDPTPWFYDAMLEYSLSRPVSALEGLAESSRLNDDRAVYRSRQLLDEDSAARSASQATVYNELGLGRLGLAAASQSLGTDPGNASAHRFLADIYATAPRQGISRASELLQAQLRQPLGAPALQSQLANDVNFKSDFFGPSTLGLNEFNTLFIRDGLQFQVFGLAGNENTYGDQVVVSGIHGPLSFSLSQLATDTDGYRQNNDDETRQYDVLVQGQFGARTSAQLEIMSTNRKFGDLTSSFDPSFFSPLSRNDVEIENYRFGLRQVIDSTSDVLVSAIAQHRESSLEEPDPDFPFTFLNEEDIWKAELQYLKAFGATRLVLGASYFDGDSTLDVINPFFPFTIESEPTHANAYAYLFFEAGRHLPVIELGLTYDDLEAGFDSQSELNPKLGVVWTPIESLTLRMTGFRVLKRSIGSDQGLEPTQIVGFNQFFDDPDGTKSEGVGLAADYRGSNRLTAGLQFGRRELESPFLLDGEVAFEHQREETVGGYVYWLPKEQMSLVFEPRYQDFRHGSTFDEMRLTELPLTLRYIGPSGWRFGLTATAVDQEGEFDGPGGVVAPGSDSFVVLDATLGLRLPGRLGTISLDCSNLLNEEFRYQEIDVGVQPRYVPEAQFRLRVSLNFR